MLENALKRLEKRFLTQNNVYLRFIQRCKGGVVPVRLRAATGDELARCVITDRLELPDAANQLEVANTFALAGQNTNHLVVRAVQG